MNLGVNIYRCTCIYNLYITRKIQHKYHHGIIMQTGITCKKIPCYMRGSACRWFIVKKPKIFQSYIKHF